MSSLSHVRVGIGVLITKNGKYLFGKRLGKHATGYWAPPGGHLEMGESWEDCARREVQEETGLTLGNIRFGTLTNDIFSPEKHYITILLIAEYIGGEPQNLEPEKCAGWDWFSWDTLPEPLFLTEVTAKNMGWDPRDASL